ncbi:MAG: 3-deoxy-8-phosphooctulonate synthase [Phycisphaerae bacterium]
MNNERIDTCRIGEVTVGAGRLTIIAGPCMAEGLDMCLQIGETMRDLCTRLDVGYVFKASFDKANRSSVDSYRGPGLETGLEWLATVGRKLGVPVLTDIHEPCQATPAAQAVDALQIPAFLCRQTDLLVAAGDSGCAVNIKKGQFMAPMDMSQAVRKVCSTGNRNVALTERGTTFGYNRLITDFRGVVQMQSLAPVLMDATHSTQEPGGLGHASGGRREFALPLAKAALAVGADGLFVETHPDPDNARSDAACQVPLEEMDAFLSACLRVFQAVRT